MADEPKKHHKEFKFIVDGKQFEFDQEIITGAQIRAIAQIDPTYALFLEEHGPGPDQQIQNDTKVNLADHGERKFYTIPPANFGLRLWV